MNIYLVAFTPEPNIRQTMMTYRDECAGRSQMTFLSQALCGTPQSSLHESPVIPAL
jgi:hypothetical protein